MEDTIEIRPAHMSDLDGIGRLIARSYRALLAPDYDPAVLRDALPMIARANPALVGCGTYFLVCDGDRALASGGWTDASPLGRAGTRGEGHIRHVATDPAATRQGHARRLMDRVIASARDSGVTRLHCQSTLTAEPFYKSMGFKPRGRIDIRLAPGVLFPAVQMIRED